MKFGKWFWASLVLTVTLGTAIQQHYRDLKPIIVVQMPAPQPPSSGGSGGRSPQNPCTSMSKCN